jgi:hypothetical protein
VSSIFRKFSVLDLFPDRVISNSLVLLYENTIKEMNQKMKIALKKEQERRKKAEFDVQRLKVYMITIYTVDRNLIC